MCCSLPPAYSPSRSEPSSGFSGVEVTAVPIVWRFPSVDAAVANYVGTPNFIAMLDRLSTSQRTDAVAGLTDLIGRHAGPDGVRLDAMVLLGSGAA